MDDLIRDLIEWCPTNGADAWPIMRQAAAELRTLRAELKTTETKVAVLEEALRELEKRATNALAAIDKYNTDNGTFLIGGALIQLAKATGTASAALETDNG
jgi:hypothetical protein